MSVILAFVTATVLVLLGLFGKRKPQTAPEPVLVKRYVHPGHAWMRETGDGYVVVGIDSFAQSVIGSVHDIRLPRLLSRVRQGEGGWDLWHGNRHLRMVSPVSGWVVEKNEMVLHNPGLVNAAPYGDGWLFKVKPARLAPQLSNLLTGKAAQAWQETVREQLRRFFSTTPALMMQDGGVIVDNLAERCSDLEWQGLTRDFFLNEEESHTA
jgi:glycine cleavage system H protein